MHEAQKTMASRSFLETAHPDKLALNSFYQKSRSAEAAIRPGVAANAVYRDAYRDSWEL